MTLAEAGQIVGMLGGGVLLTVTCGKVIMAAGKLIAGLETLTTFCARLEVKFDQHQRDNTKNNEDFRDVFAEHDTRIGVLEYATGLVERRQSMPRIMADSPNRDSR